MKKTVFKLFIILLLNLSVSSYLLADPEVPWPATLSIPDPVPDNCITSPRKGTVDLKCDGLLFTLHVPEVCLKKACGLIVDIHGYLMTADLQNYYTDLAKRGGNEGYIVIQPTANKGSYGRSWEYRVDNVSKIFSFIAGETLRSISPVMRIIAPLFMFSTSIVMVLNSHIYYYHYINKCSKLNKNFFSLRNLY